MQTWNSILNSGIGIIASLRAALVSMPSPPEPTLGGLPIDPDLLPPTQDSAPSSSPPRKRFRRRIYRPAAGSLYDLMHQQAGTSLFVRPLFWGDNHVQLLGVNFKELPSCDTPLPVDDLKSLPSRGHMRPSKAIVTLSDSLTDILLPTTPHHSMSSEAVKAVMGTLWPEAFSSARFYPELHIFFGDRAYREAVRAQVMWQFPIPKGAEQGVDSFQSISTRPATSFGLGPVSLPSSPVHNPAGHPMMCYLGKKQLESMRRSIFRVATGPPNVLNEPVWRLQQHRVKMLMPADPDQDPHVVGIFLAMAQRHFYGAVGAMPRREYAWRRSRGCTQNPVFHDVSLRILTQDNDTAEFIVYSTTVKAGFLQRFHNPFSAPVDKHGELPGMDIKYTRVPIWPILGLRERMGKALGQDIVGSFDPDQVETWEDEEEEVEAIQAKSGKRKREVLSEVLNNSFDDEASDDSSNEPSVSGKKRCLSEGAPVGMVA